MAPSGHRIWIKGGSGAGKSTLAVRLAKRLGVPYVELDALHHGPNWTPATPLELQERVRRALANDRGWVVDGNYDSKLGTVLDGAELIVWLDLPLCTKLARLVRRTWQRWVRNEELWNGNRENLINALWGRDALFPWAVQTHFRHRQHWPQKLAGQRFVRLLSPVEVEQWFATFCASPSRDTSVGA